MKNSIFHNKMFRLFLSLFLCLPFAVYGQVSCEERLMREINFAFTGEGATPERWHFNQTNASASGFIFDYDAFAFVPSGDFATPRMAGIGTNNTTRQHAVVTNPNVLNPQFADMPTPDGMLVINPLQEEHDLYFSLLVGGLIPGNEYTIEITLHNVLAIPTCAPNGLGCNADGGWTNAGDMLRVVGIVNQGNPENREVATDLTWSGTNGSGVWNIHGNPIKHALLPAEGNGATATFVANITAPTSPIMPTTQFTFDFSKTDTDHPVVLGVSSIRIFGDEEEMIAVVGGSTNVCENEQVRLIAFGLGPVGSPITWTHNSMPVSDVTTNFLVVDMPDISAGNQVFTATGIWSSQSITLTPVTCGQDTIPRPVFCYNGEQVVIFRESFNVGTFNAYGRADISGLGVTTTICSSLSLNLGPEGIGNGQYAVVRSSHDGGFWHFPHSPGQVHERTGIPGSGALLVNATAATGIVFKHRLENLYEGTLYEFSAYFVSLSVGAETPIRLRFEVLAGEEIIALIDTGNFFNVSAGVVPEWQRAAITFSTAEFPPGTDFFVQIRNSQPGGHGNDFMIDDISVSKCLPNNEDTTNIISTEISEEKTVVAFYSIMGVRLRTAPERGIYIVVFCDGSTEKRANGQR